MRPRRRLTSRGFVIWLTGLSASGKTTIAKKLEIMLKEIGVPTCCLDGDIFRKTMSAGLGYSLADRRENLRRAGIVASILADAGVVCLASFISPARADRKAIRAALPRGCFVEVYINTSLSTCIKRDKKNLYQRAILGKLKNLPGINFPYEPPQSPNIIVETELMSSTACAKHIMSYIRPRLAAFAKR